MRHVSLRKIAFSICMIGAVLLLPLDLVYCINPVITIMGKEEADKLEILCDAINDSIGNEDITELRSGLDVADTGWDFVSFDISDNKNIELTVDMNTYKKLTAENQQLVMQRTLTEITDSDVSRSTRNKIYNDMCKLDEPTTALVRQLSEDVRADFAGAYSSFRPFSSTLGWVMGVIALAMFITIGLSCVVDIAYINLPFIQNILYRDGNKKPKFVSLEAHKALLEADSKTNEYVSPNSIYLRNRGKQYVIVFICLLYLCSGQLFSLVANIMDYFRGLL